MTCREFVELTTDYLEGALPEDRRAAVRAHLAECDGCTTYLEQMRHTITALANLGRNGDYSKTTTTAITAFRRLYRRG